MAQTAAAQPTIPEEESEDDSTVAEDEEDRPRARPDSASETSSGETASGSSDDDYDKLSEGEQSDYDEDSQDDDMESEEPNEPPAAPPECCVIAVATDCCPEVILEPCGTPCVPCAPELHESPPSPSARPPPSYSVEWPSPDGKPASVSFQDAPDRPGPPSEPSEADDEEKTSWMREDERCCTCAVAVRVIVCFLTIACCAAGLILTVLGVLEKHRQCTATGCILLLTGAGLCMHLCLRNTAPPRRVDMLHVIRETTLRKRLAEERRDSLHSRDSGEREGGCRAVVMPARKRSGSIWNFARRMSMTADASMAARRSISNSSFGHGHHLHNHRVTSFGHVDHYDHYHYSYM